MTFNESKEFINIIKEYLTHEAYNLYTISITTSPPKEDSDSEPPVPMNNATDYLNNVINVFQTAINTINSAFSFVYHDPTLPGNTGENINFIKINSYSELFRNYQMFDNTKFTKDETYSYICELLFIAIKKLESEHIYNGGSLNTLRSILNLYDLLYNSFVPEPPESNTNNTTGETTTITYPKQHQFWIMNGNLAKLQSDLVLAMPVGTTI